MTSLTLSPLDLHPDPFYKPNTDPNGEHPCHAGSGTAGYFGAETTDCDTPFTLINATFDWIKENVRDEIDFVVWTGDSARHDNDESLPRNDKSVVNLNRFVVNKFVEVFGKTDNINDPDPTNDFVIPIVPTFGNNDILPHNIFEPGPNRWTRKYIDVWNRFIPQEQRHSFSRGGWFFTEVIPNKLAVFSLNTLYFFDSNSAVDGCDLKSEPGYEHMEWLRIQLQFLRIRQMKAILIGHVPPARTESKQNWDETCYQKYTLWMRQYRDVIVGSIFGHMNVDHFMFQDIRDLKYKFTIDGIDDDELRNNELQPQPSNETFSISAKAAYLKELRDSWSTLPKPPKNLSVLEMLDMFEGQELVSKKKGGKGKKQRREDQFLKDIGGQWAERFSLSLVSPSVVPNFFPSLRVIEYNITGLKDHHPASGAVGKPAESYIDLNSALLESTISQNEDQIQIESIEVEKKKKKKKKGKKKPNKPNFPIPKPPSKTTSPGPAYSPQTLSFLSWTQYYANLTKINEEHQKAEQLTKKNHRHQPVQFKIEYTTNNDTHYQMQDLTVRQWIDLAQKIGRKQFRKNDQKDDEDIKTVKAKNSLWRTFLKRAFVQTKLDEELDNDFDM